MGLTLDGASGVLSGTPVKTGNVAFTVAAANGVDPAATQGVVIKISPAKGTGGKGNGHGNSHGHGR
jgi:Putative Ig domain